MSWFKTWPLVSKIVTKFIAIMSEGNEKVIKGRGVAFVSSNFRHLKIIAIQYSKESSGCVVACSFYFIME